MNEEIDFDELYRNIEEIMLIHQFVNNDSDKKKNQKKFKKILKGIKNRDEEVIDYEKI